MKLLLFGSTGLVGRHVLALALADSRVGAVVTPARRRVQRPDHEKLLSPVVDFERLPAEADWWQADAVICTLGTTIRKAGSQDAFRRVDHDYPVLVACLALAHGTPAFVLNSALGANPASRFFYNRVKGEVERDVAALGFRSLIIVRPGLIGGEREKVRPAERAGSVALTILSPLLPRALRINLAPTIARAMIEAAVTPPPGTHIVTSAELA
jgi:uncharacterized protein YbjT (DUF2867 family)